MFVVKQYKTKRLYDGKFENVIGIGYKNESGTVFPSPLTQFLIKEYRNKGNSLNSQRNAAYTITAFMNFIHLQVSKGMYPELSDFGLKALTLQMGADYITFLSMQNKAGELSKTYVLNKIVYLNKFYVWLRRQNIIDDNFKIVNKPKTYKGHKTEVINLFEDNDLDIIFPTKSTYKHLHLKDFGIEGKELILLLLQTARREDRLMTLGIVLQIFCGLRRAEIVNLMEFDFKWSSNNLVIKVRDHQDTLFSHLTDTSGVEVKTPGDQICLFTEIVEIYYKEHMKFLKECKNRKHKGLFINLNTGIAISGKSYAERFNKIKVKFLEALLEKNDIKNYYLLINNDWSTHIGRGIYTNLLSSLGLTPTQTALLRRDKNIHSAEAYQEIFTLTLSMNAAINNFDLLNQFKIKE